MQQEPRHGHRGTLDSAPRTAQLWERVTAAVDQRAKDVGRPLRIVDLGGGSGGLAVPLAELGHEVLVVDPSPDALASLQRRAREVGLEETDLDEAGQRLRAVQGDSATLAGLDLAGDVDLVTCHGVLALDDDPARTVSDIAAVLAPDGLLSLLVAQRFAVVLARALSGRFAQARLALDSEDGRWGEHDPLPRRYDADAVERLLHGAGLRVEDSRGLRVFTDLVPSAFVDTEADRDALLALERALTEHPDQEILGRLGSALHVLARRPA